MKKKMKQLAGQEGGGATPLEDPGGEAATPLEDPGGEAALPPSHQEGESSSTPTSLPAPPTTEEPVATPMDEDTPMLDFEAAGEEDKVRSKLDHAPMGAEFETQGDSPRLGGPAPPKSKLKFCDNCGNELLSRIQVCAGCKKVAYCNFRCQKASWKMHKKTCSYALRKDGKESTG